GAELLGNEDIALHDAELVGGVAEVAAARTDHHLQSDLDLLAHRSNHARAGRGAAFGQAGAELDAVGAPALRVHGGLHRIQADFKLAAAWPDLRLRYHTRQRFSRTMGWPALQPNAS